MTVTLHHGSQAHPGTAARTARSPGPRREGLNDVSQQLGRMLNNAKWRVRFLHTWTKMAFGFEQPRRLQGDPTQGLTFVLPGIEAESAFTYGVCDGLIRGGVQGAVRVFNWGLPFPGGYLSNLCRIDRNRRRAADLAAEIVKYQDRHPGKPVTVVAHSGGCGVAVWALEALPANRAVDAVVLLSGALSPTYDLTHALRKTRGGILNSYSCRDFLVLGWGTRIFGTTDRRFVEGCGFKGFVPPETLPAEARRLYDEKLTQVSWTEEMIESCYHSGGHLTSANEGYLHKYICPWLNPRCASSAAELRE